MYIHRHISQQLQRAAQQFRAVFLTGPRQSGKTTLLKNLFPGHHYINLEEPDTRQWAKEQPRDFLSQNPAPLIIDEAQNAPELFSYIQSIVDKDPKPGMYLLSGSQNFLMMEKIAQSLAGRTAVLSLYPLSWEEMQYITTQKTTNELIIQGFYPGIFQGIQDISLFYIFLSFLYAIFL